MTRCGAAVLLGAAIFAVPSQARADSSNLVDALVTAAFVGGSALMLLVPVDIERKLPGEILPFDEGVKGNFSEEAGQVSNATLGVSIAVPLGLQAGSGLDDESARAMLIYAEALAVTIFLNTATKYIVQRPRPYVYAEDPFIQKYVASRGGDSRLSFYSGHSATSFAAAVAGSWLFARRTDDEALRAGVWGLQLFVAAATADMRVQAGQHFYSDVIVGGLVGSLAGVLVPFIHGDTRKYDPTGWEFAAMAAGLAGGVLVGELWPFDRNILVPLSVPDAEGNTAVGAGVIGTF